MSLVTLEEAQGRVGDAITQDNIDEVEDELRVLIGPLIGTRTETYYLTEARHPRWQIDGLWLSRRTDAVIVTNATTGEAATQLTAGTDYRLVDGLLIEHITNGASWLDVLAATYDPNDEEIVRSVIYDTLSYRQTPTGIQSVRIGAYSETFFPAGSGGTTSSDPVMGSLLRRVLPAAGMGLTSPYRYRGVRRDRSVIVGTGS
jgi:hypothetical protein